VEAATALAGGSGGCAGRRVAGILVYVAARAAGVPMKLTEVFETTYARMPVMNSHMSIR
jgi:hypothetical protein